MKKYVKQISHVCFSCQEISETRIFYEEILGFDVIHEFRNNDGEIYGLYLKVGNSTFIEFFQKKDERNMSETFRHICFVVDDLKIVVKRLGEIGQELQIKRGKTDNTMQAWILDPNGIKIEFHQYDSTSLLNQFQDNL
jgi:catechol 2,3-dioxygenase-like lactoylglutathione lyase family enzyme